MPTTLSGLLLFVVLLLPGLCYVVRLERGTRPGKSGAITAFRETVTVVVASVLALAVVGVLFVILRVLAPGATPDVGRLVRAQRGDYFRADYVYLATWSVALVVLAMVLAYLAARFDVNRWIETNILREPGGGQRPQSAWYMVFEDERAERDHRKKYLVCRLSDGTEFEGALASYNPIADDTPDRDLVIAPPHVMRLADGTVQRFDFGGVILSARSLIWIRFEFLLDDEVEERFATWAPRQPSAAAAPAAS